LLVIKPPKLATRLKAQSDTLQERTNWRVLKLVNISKQFGPTLLFQDVNIEVIQGERFFILGPSGCGKTTLLRIITGLDNDYEGSVEINNTKMDSIPSHKRKIGFVFQDGALWPHLTVEKHLSYAPGASERKDWNDFLLNLTNLKNRTKDYPSSLSGGERQRLALARALSSKPNLLLLDEPLRNLDRNLALELREAIVEILEKTETTSIFVTHDQEEALSMADRILLLENGGPVQVGSPEEIYNKPATSWVASFFGPVNTFEAITGPGGIVATSLGEFETSLPEGAKCTLVLKAHQVEARSNGDGIEASVKRKIFRGDNIYLICDASGTSLTALSRTMLQDSVKTVRLTVSGEPAIFDSKHEESVA